METSETIPLRLNSGGYGCLPKAVVTRETCQARINMIFGIVKIEMHNYYSQAPGGFVVKIYRIPDTGFLRAGCCYMNEKLS